MKTILLIFLLSFGLKAQPIQKDEALHLMVGAISAYGMGKYIYKKFDMFGLSMVTGYSFSMGLTLSKEFIHDKQWQRGTFSYNDIFYGYIGDNYGTFYLAVDIGSHRKKENEYAEKKIQHFEENYFANY